MCYNATKSKAAWRKTMENHQQDRLTENFKIMIDEAHADRHSPQWKNAVRDLRSIHADLPDVATLAARNLPASDNNMMAQRLANTSIREVSAIGKDNLSDSEMKIAVRRTHRSVLMQEAANQITVEKDGINNAENFMKLKEAMRPEMTPGRIAIAALEKQGIDARRLLREMPEKEIKAISVGAYDRVSGPNRDKITGALEITTSQDALSANKKEAGLPVMRAMRNQFAKAPRANTFGKKIMPAQIQQQSMAM